MGEPSDLERQLAELRQAYLNDLPAKLQELDTAADLIRADPVAAAARPGWEALHFHSHKLAGSGATFGVPDISTVAHEIEAACDGIAKNGEDATEALWAEVEGLVAQMHRVVDDNVAGRPDAGTDDVDPLTLPGASEEIRRIVIIGDVPGGGTLPSDLATFGFDVDAIADADALPDALGRGLPIAVVAFGSGTLLPDGGTTLPIADGDTENPSYPLIVLSDDGGLAARVAAVRAGCDAFLVTPVDANVIVDAIDQLVSDEQADPFRVLVVDDEPAVADHTKIILQSAGMIATAISDPTAILEELVTFAPELILLDLHMEGLEGHELAKVIRQQEEYTAVPIVFLSKERDPKRQMGAMRRGGDDFLTKPIQADQLIARVRVRAQRFRRLRALMINDSLTGLLNHSTTLQFLENEMDRARRNKVPLSFAMIDIDHFKSVNDNHGHAVGDQVIKSLSHLLKRRLRRADVVGRMGGEEFGVVLAGANREQARTVMDEVRRAFADIRHRAGDQEITVTVSCGIAEFPALDSGAKLTDAADKALYTAKQGGRNRVELAPGD